METTVETKLTASTLRIVDETIVKIGRDMSLDLIDLLHDSAYSTLESYLAKHQAPEEVIKLIDDLDLMMMIQEQKQHGELPDISAQMLAESIGPMTARIANLGGTLEQKATWGEEVIKWPEKSN